MPLQPPAKFFVNQGVVTSREDMLNLLRPLLKQTVSYRYLRGRDVAAHGTGWVERIVVGRNQLHEEDGSVRARDTGERETIECGLVLRSIGYLGKPLDEGLPFDERRGVMSNESGRVTDGGEQVPGLYATGWIKRGPSGVIGTNKKDSQETVNALLEDLAAGRVPEPELAADATAIESVLAERVPDHITYEGWQSIDDAEKAAGEPHGRPRVKFCRVEEMVEAASGVRPQGPRPRPRPAARAGCRCRSRRPPASVPARSTRCD